MKTITKNYEVYSFEELSQEAKDKARIKHNDDNDYMFLSDDLNNKLHELLEENNIKDENDTSKAGTTPTPVLYSLSHSQGDGAMFQGHFTWKKYQVIIKQSGHYYHSNSKSIEITYGDDIANEADEKVCEQFEKIYQKICKELEDHGYNFIEYEDSEEHFREECEANEWTFLKDGKMFNE